MNELDRQDKLERQALQKQSAEAVEAYLVAAIDIADRHLDPAFFEKNPHC